MPRGDHVYMPPQNEPVKLSDEYEGAAIRFVIAKQRHGIYRAARQYHDDMADIKIRWNLPFETSRLTLAQLQRFYEPMKEQNA